MTPNYIQYIEFIQSKSGFLGFRVEEVLCWGVLGASAPKTPQHRQPTKANPEM
jgi:hypothetical protein